MEGNWIVSCCLPVWIFNLASSQSTRSSFSCLVFIPKKKKNSSARTNSPKFDVYPREPSLYAQQRAANSESKSECQTKKTTTASACNRSQASSGYHNSVKSFLTHTTNMRGVLLMDQHSDAKFVSLLQSEQQSPMPFPSAQII